MKLKEEGNLSNKVAPPYVGSVKIPIKRQSVCAECCLNKYEFKRCQRATTKGGREGGRKLHLHVEVVKSVSAFLKKAI